MTRKEKIRILEEIVADYYIIPRAASLRRLQMTGKDFTNARRTLWTILKDDFKLTVSQMTRLYPSMSRVVINSGILLGRKSERIKDAVEEVRVEYKHKLQELERKENEQRNTKKDTEGNT